ncbi:minor extracellular protease Epr precursor [Oxobacter pfennigii]|uniref:Minor extracellular protease Epr n=1 Tax=Oxobacter pfennigii TaxID=36849 RepID=A0A0P8W7B2_9CLOT|nr:S8/S53 family peptidase [Oxobacter pfennigii]KPU43675.1 minor extracellular protease Epr precursor [Oxobacter pfennigii]
MLRQNKKVFEAANILKWYENGYTGKNVNIAVLDDQYAPHSHTRVILPIAHHNPIIKGYEFHKPNSCSVVREACPDANIYGFNWFGGARETTRWLIENREKIDIVNCSFSSPKNSREELWNVLEKLDIPFICSSGNNGSSKFISYPSCLDWTISIGAYNLLKDEIPEYSNEGEGLEALGFTYIYIPNSVENPFPFEGTSAAASLVTGMLGLYIGWRKVSGKTRLTIEEAKQFIVNNCSDTIIKNSDSKSAGVFILPDFDRL